MAVKIDKKRHPPSFHHLANQLRNSEETVREEKEKRRLAMLNQEKGAKLRKIVTAAMTQI